MTDQEFNARVEEFKGTITFFFHKHFPGRPYPTDGQMAAFLTFCRNGGTGDQIDHILYDEPEAKAIREAAANIKPLPSLHIHDNRFEAFLAGVDQFTSFKMFLDGADLAPLIEESKHLGATLWRVFGQGSAAQNGILDLRPSHPGYYDHLRPFVSLLNQNGIIPLLTVYVDNQDVKSGPDHLGNVLGQVSGSSTLVSLGNEAPKNGFDPMAFDRPRGVLCSRGSNLADALPYSPYWDFAEFHPRRDWPKTELDAVASPIFLSTEKGLNVPLIIDEPIGAADTTIDGKRSSDPGLFYRLGRIYSVECGGAIFHNDYGMRGQTMSATVLACAEAFFRGVKG